ncbi:hypothetical protein CPLU01_15919 [Colletotrichum plurivorum]|uniref:Uncharacterized protein n=1 Tax=Colletotrichum plurivorum TaxID=2175906 RepID=A0A8H6J4I9_9PEZI|nr:hypothetical protein CPLU01_15919 [Colletotrichum plurivorum]
MASFTKTLPCRDQKGIRVIVLALDRESQDVQEDPQFEPEFEPADTQRRDERRWEQQKGRVPTLVFTANPDVRQVGLQTCRGIRGPLRHRRKSVSIRPWLGTVCMIGPDSLDAGRSFCHDICLVARLN